jgi:hypothetical protein
VIACAPLRPPEPGRRAILQRLRRGARAGAGLPERALAALDEQPGPRFLSAALEIDSGRFESAAETLRRIGALPLEAEARVLASRERHEAGDDAGGREQLARARELLQALGARARLRDLDA